MANKKIPLRKWVGCNAMKEKKEMIRVIKTPENEIVLDATGRRRRCKSRWKRRRRI